MSVFSNINRMPNSKYISRSQSCAQSLFNHRISKGPKQQYRENLIKNSSKNLKINRGRFKIGGRIRMLKKQFEGKCMCFWSLGNWQMIFAIWYFCLTRRWKLSALLLSSTCGELFGMAKQVEQSNKSNFRHPDVRPMKCQNRARSNCPNQINKYMCQTQNKEYIAPSLWLTERCHFILRKVLLWCRRQNVMASH